jgi:quercetin dioxygenase-like cupin family protein
VIGAKHHSRLHEALRTVTTELPKTSPVPVITVPLSASQVSGKTLTQSGAWVSLESAGMQIWELDRLRVAAHHPQILRSDEGASRVIALLLPQGECLQEHQVHEHALVFVLRGELLVSAGASERSLSAPSLIHFGPTERHEMRAISECQLVLCLAPWPGPGHPSQPTTA